MDKDPVSGARASERLREQASTVAEDLRELGHLTTEAAREKLEQARRSAADYYEQGRRKAGELEEQVEGYVRQKPIQSVLMAAGLGVIVGYCLSRRR